MEVYTKCRMEFCEAKLMGPQPCNMVKANVILQVMVKVTELTKMNIVTNVEGALVDRCRIRVEDIIGRKCHQENVNQTIDVNAPMDVDNMLVKSTKNMTACVRNVSYEKICNKVIIKGVIHVQVYYVACNCEQELRETSADIPFTTVVNFDCINEDTMIRCRERVEYTDAKIEGAPCQTSKIRAVAILEICVCAFQTKDFMVVTNVCTNGTCNTQAQQMPQPKPIPKPQPKPEPKRKEKEGRDLPHRRLYLRGKSRRYLSQNCRQLSNTGARHHLAANRPLQQSVCAIHA